MTTVFLFEDSTCFETIETKLNVTPEFIECKLARKYEKMKETGNKKIGQLSANVCNSSTGENLKYWFEYGKYNDMKVETLTL